MSADALAPTKNRLQYFDIAKGIALIAVVLGHIGIRSINSVVYTFHLPVFFIVTGYFINKKRSILDFIKNKARYLLLPYALICIIYFFFAKISGIDLSVKQWLVSALYAAGDSYTEPFTVQAIGVPWFLWAAFWASCFLRLSLEFKPQLRILFVGLLFAFGYYTPKYLFWFPLSIQAGACALFYMYIGWLVRSSNISTSLIRTTEYGKVVVIIAFFVWLCFMKNFTAFWMVHSNLGNGFMDIFGSLCGSLIIILLSMVLSKKTYFISKLLSFIGENGILWMTVHKVEHTCVHWTSILNYLMQHGFPAEHRKLIYIFIKLIFIFICVFILSRFRFIRVVWGTERTKR